MYAGASINEHTWTTNMDIDVSDIIIGNDEQYLLQLSYCNNYFYIRFGFTSDNKMYIQESSYNSAFASGGRYFNVAGYKTY